MDIFYFILFYFFFLWVLLFLTYYDQTRRLHQSISTFYNFQTYKAQPSKNNIHLGGIQQMKTSSDRQPFCCQNTFYKQFMSVLHFYIFTRSQDLPSPSLSPHPRRDEATNWSNSDIRTLNKILRCTHGTQKFSKLQQVKRSSRPNFI